MTEARAAEYVGQDSDEVVTATCRGEEVEITLHVTAKRRLDREDLGAAIVEAVQSAEDQAQQASMEAFEATLTNSLSQYPDLLAGFREGLRGGGMPPSA